VGDDRSQVCIPWGPSEPVAEFLTARDQRRGVAVAARAHYVRNCLAGDFLHRTDHLQHATAGAGADIELVARAAVQQVLDGKDVRLRQVVNVDVVADATAVRRGVIVAEDGYRPAGFDGPQNERNQMRLGFVLFAERRLGIGAGGIEVAQADAGEEKTMCFTPPCTIASSRESDPATLLVK
jgi:hypothetical protein